MPRNAVEPILSLRIANESSLLSMMFLREREPPLEDSGRTYSRLRGKIFPDAIRRWGSMRPEMCPTKRELSGRLSEKQRSRKSLGNPSFSYRE